MESCTATVNQLQNEVDTSVESIRIFHDAQHTTSMGASSDIVTIHETLFSADNPDRWNLEDNERYTLEREEILKIHTQIVC